MTAAASALPWSWYTDPAILDAELERVFRPGWQYVGHTGDLARSAGWFPGKLAGTPVLVTRDQGRLRALLAVCRHQGATINPPARAGTAVTCAYHGWVYGLDGVLRDAPSSRGKPGFDPATHALPELPVATWGPLVFAAADPASPPLAAALGSLPGRLAAAGVDVDGMAFERRSRTRIVANWKQVVEGALAGAATAGLVYPATTVEVLPGRVDVGAVLPAGPEAAERVVDSFAALGAGSPRPEDAGATFRRRLREALGGG